MQKPRDNTPRPANPALVTFFRMAHDLAELARQREAEAAQKIAERQQQLGAEKPASSKQAGLTNIHTSGHCQEIPTRL